MAVDINSLLDSAANNVIAIKSKLEAFDASNKDLQEKVVSLSQQVETLKSQVDSGVLPTDLEKKLQDLSALLGQLAK